MPGIYGVINKVAKKNTKLSLMSKSMNLYPHFIQDDEFYCDYFSASRLHLGYVGEKKSPIKYGSILIWIEGEAYNLDEVCQFFYLEENVFAHSMAEAYQKGVLDSYLNKIDGYFCAVIFDQQKKIIKLVTDRYGMRFLYWYYKDGIFAWASEVKGLLALDEVNRTIDKTSLPCFMELGYLLGDHTWFEYIKLLDPATVLEFDFQNDKIEKHRYWKWSEIQKSNLSFENATIELGNRFIRAVERRFNPDENIGISLSGGLDSRAIIAAIDHLHPEYKGYAYTFGVAECDDIIIAEQVISITNWQHQCFYFNEDNWFKPRFEKIWNTDGLQDMKHMHGSEFLRDVSEHMHINMNGYAGDAIVGGGFLNNLPFDTRANAQNIEVFYKDQTKLLNIEDDFYHINKVEPIIYMNRIRRFTTMGSINALTHIEQRKPFLDNAIVELMFSLPDEYRSENRIYSAMLLKFFPDFFKIIPWQKTGKPVGLLKKASILKRASNKLTRIIGRGLNLKLTSEYTNYGEWVRSRKVAYEIKQLLSQDNSLYDDHEKIDFTNSYLKPHFRSRIIDKSDQILRAVTFKIYLGYLSDK